jgi:hypothetical protein
MSVEVRDAVIEVTACFSINNVTKQRDDIFYVWHPVLLIIIEFNSILVY